MEKVVLVGNCHIHNIARCLELMADVEVIKIRLTSDGREGKGWKEQFLNEAESSDYIGVISTFKRRIIEELPDFEERIDFIPHIRTREFHPDAIYASSENGPIYSLMGRSNSAIILQGYIDGLDAGQIKALFNNNIYNNLGYFDQKGTEQWINHQNDLTGWPVDEIFKELRASGPFVYTSNHPKLYALSKLALIFAERNGIKISYKYPEEIIHDTASSGAIWPVYPEIGKKLGLSGDYVFKIPENLRKETNRSSISITLDEFIEDSLERYSSIDRKTITIANKELRTKLENLKNSKEFNGAMRRAKDPNGFNQANPYRDLPDYQFWRKSISSIPLDRVDPVVSAKYNIKKSDKVATAGSCFAQHMSNALSKSGFTYYVTENPDSNLTKEEIKNKNYGIYSARYGNIYTTRQLVQTIDRAYGEFVPTDDVWMREDGMYVDPFRPLIEPEGFENIVDLHKARDKHYACIREMLENLDIFVFTLGLTEAWRSKIDQAVFPLAPGVAGGNMDDSKYEFVNFDAFEIIEDLNYFKDKLSEINPNAKILLTVSPVPLIATYEDRNVLVSTTYSKSALRVAVEKVCNENTNIAYFPSYEIITGNFNRGHYFEDDLRSVKKEGVAHVMRLLMHHYPEKEVGGPSMEELEEAEIICDEEAIDN